MEEGKLQVQPNIKKIKLKDGIERDYIDTYEKLYWIVNERFKLQEKYYPNDEPMIDLSQLVIDLHKEKCSTFWIGRLCGIIAGVVNLGDDTDLYLDEKNTVVCKNEIQFEIKYEINFENSILYSMQFWNTRFLKYVNFSNVCFRGSTDVCDSIFFEDVKFTQIDISQDVDSRDKLRVIIGNILFQNIIFKKAVAFDCEKWNKCNNFQFNGNTFEDDVNFMFCTITDSNGIFYDFTNSNFKGDVLIDSRGNSDSCTLISHIKFNGSYFHKKLKIVGVEIGSLLLQNCHFDNTVNISRNKYDESSKIDFTFSTINSLFFIDSDLGGLEGEPIQLSKEISFSKSLITKEAFIFLRNINKNAIKQGCLNFEYANILGTITIQDSKLEKLKLDKSTLIGDINIENVETEYDSRESIAKIKNEYFQRNDIVNLLFYKAKEMKYYSEHLDFKYKFITNIFHWFTKNWLYNTIGVFFLPILLLLSLLPIKSLEKVREYTLLYLNRISNSFGMNWGQGVLFTCVTACFFFVLINTWGVKSTPLFVWGWNGSESFGEVWKYYLHMFYLIDFKDKFNDIIKDGIIKHDGIKLNALGETLFFVSKIFVSYGIYQTISAFRKYGK